VLPLPLVFHSGRSADVRAQTCCSMATARVRSRRPIPLGRVAILQTTTEQLDRSRRLDELGVDSLMAADLMVLIQRRL